jgi:maleate cis-trans isomerase
MRTSYVVEAVEADTGKQLIATDLALFWAVMQTCDIEPAPGTGSLLESLRSEPN